MGQGNCSFPVNENEKDKEEEEEEWEGGGEQRGRGGDHNCNAFFPSNGAELYSWAKAIVSFQ